jgi:hypothetical protein
MELILKYFLSIILFVSKILGNSIGNHILRRNKVQNFGKDLEMQYAMNA